MRMGSMPIEAAVHGTVDAASRAARGLPLREHAARRRALLRPRARQPASVSELRERDETFA